MKLAALLLLATAAGTAQGQAQADEAETVAIRIDQSRPCAGLCPDFEVSVDQSAQVTVRDHGLRQAERYAPGLQYAVSAGSATVFRSVLRPLRPAWGSPERTDWLSRYIASNYHPEIVITWRSGDRVARLTASRGDQEIYPLVREALEAIDVDELGTHRGHPR